MPTIYSNRNQGFFPSIFSDFNRIFDDNWLIPRIHSTSPAINVTEDEKEYKVEVAAPGMTKDDFRISLTAEDDLLISLEKKEEKKETDSSEEKKKYLRREFSYSKFEQQFTLPVNVDKQNITAQMTDGVLSIAIPKMTPEEKAQETRFIEIK